MFRYVVRVIAVAVSLPRLGRSVLRPYEEQLRRVPLLQGWPRLALFGVA